MSKPMETISTSMVAELTGVPLRGVFFWLDRGVLKTTAETQRTGRGTPKQFPLVEVEIARILAELHRVLQPPVPVLRDMAAFIRKYLTTGDQQGIADWRTEYTRRETETEQFADELEAGRKTMKDFPPHLHRNSDIWTWFDLMRARAGEANVVLKATMIEDGTWQMSIETPDSNGRISIGAPVTGQPVGMLVVMNLGELFASLWSHPALSGVGKEEITAETTEA